MFLAEKNILLCERTRDDGLELHASILTFLLNTHTHTHTQSLVLTEVCPLNSCHKLLMLLKLKDAFSLHVCVHICSRSTEQETQREEKCVAVEFRDLYVLHKTGQSDWDRLCNIERANFFFKAHFSFLSYFLWMEVAFIIYGEGHSHSRENMIGPKSLQCRMSHQYVLSISPEEKGCKF